MSINLIQLKGDDDKCLSCGSFCDGCCPEDMSKYSFQTYPWFFEDVPDYTDTCSYRRALTTGSDYMGITITRGKQDEKCGYFLHVGLYLYYYPVMGYCDGSEGAYYPEGAILNGQIFISDEDGPPTGSRTVTCTGAGTCFGDPVITSSLITIPITFTVSKS